MGARFEAHTGRRSRACGKRHLETPAPIFVFRFFLGPQAELEGQLEEARRRVAAVTAEADRLKVTDGPVLRRKIGIPGRA